MHGPLVVSLRSGGRIDASPLGHACVGFIAEAPDVRLMYRAGSYPLFISAVSDADTTLVVNAPDGSWHCSDDASEGDRNPSLHFLSPQHGRYEIWVGTRDAPQFHPARLEISERSGR